MEEMMEVTEIETEEAATELGTETVEESSELPDEEAELTTEAVMMVEVDNSAEIALLTQIAGDVRVVVVFTILAYCSACMRRWRNATIKGGR